MGRNTAKMPSAKTPVSASTLVRSLKIVPRYEGSKNPMQQGANKANIPAMNAVRRDALKNIPLRNHNAANAHLSPLLRRIVRVEQDDPLERTNAGGSVSVRIVEDMKRAFTACRHFHCPAPRSGSRSAVTTAPSRHAEYRTLLAPHLSLRRRAHARCLQSRHAQRPVPGVLHRKRSLCHPGRHRDRPQVNLERFDGHDGLTGCWSISRRGIRTRGPKREQCEAGTNKEGDGNDHGRLRRRCLNGIFLLLLFLL